MKRRVFHKTAPFHVKKKMQNSVVLNDTVPFSPSPGGAAGEDNFSSFLIEPDTPHACQSRPPYALMMKPRKPRPVSPTHWLANPVLWQGSKALLPGRCYKVAIGTPPLPFTL